MCRASRVPVCVIEMLGSQSLYRIKIIFIITDKRPIDDAEYHDQINILLPTVVPQNNVYVSSLKDLVYIIQEIRKCITPPSEWLFDLFTHYIHLYTVVLKHYLVFIFCCTYIHFYFNVLSSSLIYFVLFLFCLIYLFIYLTIYLFIYFYFYTYNE